MTGTIIASFREFIVNKVGGTITRTRWTLNLKTKH